MSKEECCRGVCVKRPTNGFGPHRGQRRPNAFTLTELLTVITIIIILAGLVLSTVGYAQKKAARARAETEIAAMSAACESYKADNGIYPRDSINNTTDNLAALTDAAYSSKTPPDPKPTSYDPTNTRYASASFYLYGQLSGNTNGDRSTQNQKGYFQFKSNMLLPSNGTGTVTAIRDPFGNSYGYSTAQQMTSTLGFNPTFDIWSTAGTGTTPSTTEAQKAVDAAYEAKWIKNW